MMMMMMVVVMMMMMIFLIDKDNVCIKLKTINEVLEHHLTFRLKDRKVVLHANPLARNHNLVLSSRQYIL